MRRSESDANEALARAAERRDEDESRVPECWQDTGPAKGRPLEVDPVSSAPLLVVLIVIAAIAVWTVVCWLLWSGQIDQETPTNATTTPAATQCPSPASAPRRMTLT